MKHIKLALFLFICVISTMCILLNTSEINVSANSASKLESETIEYVEIDKEDILDDSNHSAEREDASIVSEKNNQSINLEIEEKKKNDEVLENLEDCVESSTSNTHSNSTISTQLVEVSKPQVISNVNPYNYAEFISYDNFSDIEIKLINDVLNMYNAHKDSDEEYYSEEIDYLPSFQNYQKAMSFFHLYYGMFKDIYDVVFDLQIHGNQYATIRLYMNNMKKFETERNGNTSRIRNIIATFNDGTEKDLVTQAAKYIADHTTYTKNHYDIDDILTNGKGVCNAYALTLMRFCQLLGIQNDLCLGYAAGEWHAWNKVTYSDGTVEYFDVTFFDSGNRNRYEYFNMSSSPHKIDTINNYYYK